MITLDKVRMVSYEMAAAAAAIVLQIWVWAVLFKRGLNRRASRYYAVEPENASGDELVVVAVFEEAIIAELCRGKLEASGIESAILNKRAISSYRSLEQGGIQVAVKADDAQRAAAVIAEVDDSPESFQR